MEPPLHHLEKRLIKTLSESGECAIDDLSSRAEMRTDQVRRALEWLKSKGLIEVKKDEIREIHLGTEGKKAFDMGLPERRLVNLLASKGESTVDGLKTSFGSSSNEFSAALGHARRMNWIQIIPSEKGAKIRLLDVTPSIPEEEILRRLATKTLNYDEISDNERKTVDKIATRPDYVTFEITKGVRAGLTTQGAATAKNLKKRRETDTLTPDMLINGRWRRLKLRALDVEAPSPPIYPGKKHPIRHFIDEVREIFISLGFQEIEGPISQTCFWNFDALFTPQDHPAREMQDTFYVNDVIANRVADKEVVHRISTTHENGWTTGSRGWRYHWSLDKAKGIVLRTHTTSVTVKYLADFKPSEARVFSVGKVFRNEKVTFKNLVEFHQIEGITVGKCVTLRDIMGLLSSFYSRLGLKKVKFWPSYFPYTEPSLQSMVYFDKFDKWVELCGMGIFRPEVILPLGVKNPVLAWGGGLERLVMLRYGIDDARQLYENNLGWLKRVPLCP